MSLQVHLPLNGTLENKGLKDCTITNNGATVDDNGKIGKCYSISKNKYISGLLDMDSPEWSIACWVNSSGTNVSSNNTIYLICLQTYSGSTNFYAGIQLNYTNSFIVRINGSTYHLGTITTGVWHHLCVTFKNNFVHGYVDGIYLNSVSTTTPEPTSTRLEIGHRYNSNDYSFDGKINDVRIYDNCLSPKEVKEISKGLIAHYTLDNVGINPNIITDDSPSKWAFGTNNGTKTKENYENGVHITYGGDATSYAYFMYVFGANAINALQPNTQYTCSFNYKSTVDNDVNLQNIMTASYTQKLSNYIGIKQYSPSQGWVRISATFTTNDLANRQNSTAQGLYFNTDRTKSGEYWLKDFKLELGSAPTMYIKDNGYSTTIYDSSGYGNNGNDGTTPQLFSLSSDTPRYDYSTVFDGNSFIGIRKNAKVRDAISVCCWAYMDNWANYSSQRLISCIRQGGWRFVTLSSKLTFYIGTGESSNTYKYAGTKQLSSLSSGWHYFVGTYDGFSVKLYIDGVLEGTNAAYTEKTPIFYNANNGIFIGAEAGGNTTTPVGNYFNGKMSDVRIYATALSDDDVKELYDTSAFITNNGAFEGYEIIEENDEQITKTGLVKSDNFYESEAQYQDEVTWTGSGINEWHPANKVNSNTGGYGVNYANIIPDKEYVLELDLSWSGTWSYDTSQSYMITIFQGSNNGVWKGTNYLTAALNNKQKPGSIISSTPGSYHYKVTFSIPASHLETYSLSTIGTRTDYMNGEDGKFSFNNLNIYPLEQDLDTEQTKIGNNYITAKEFIEI